MGVPRGLGRAAERDRALDRPSASAGRSTPACSQPYIERYFAAIEQLWADRSYSIAETLARGLYPSPLASAELVDASTAWLAAHPDAPPALRRVVIENTAAVRARAGRPGA